MKKGWVILAVAVLLAGCNEVKKSEGPKAGLTVASVPNGANPFIVSGLVHLQKGDVKAAIQSFNDAIRENPRDVQGYIILGQTYMHLKDYKRAVETFTIATRIAPDNGQAYYLLATNLGLAGKYTLARAQAAKSIEIFRKNKDGNNFKRAIVLLQGLPQETKVKE